jgi:transposase-like protein
VYVPSKNYDKSLKQQAIQLALTSDQSIAEMVKERGILKITLCNWVWGAKSKNLPESTSLNPNMKTAG